MPPITCRQCGETHLTIQCPLRTPDERPKSWEQMIADVRAEDQEMPYQCLVPTGPGKKAIVYSPTVEEFWRDIGVARDHSLYRDCSGILNEASGVLVPPDHPLVEPGKYLLVGRTHRMPDKRLYEVLDDARDSLSEIRPLSSKKIEKVHNELLLLFNHFSLQHEGSHLGLDETAMITAFLAGKDSKREIETEEMEKINSKVPGSEHDINEAVNHIIVSQHLRHLAKEEITEELILTLHSLVMDGLLPSIEEGTPGEYRKVAINVLGDGSKRPHFADVPPLMKTFFERDLVQKDGEHIIEFLTRIHSRFQDIHPFRDGNGRMGRFIMNMFLLKQGYPVVTFPPTLSLMFNYGVQNAIRGNSTIFSRLLAEVLFSSFQAYEKALGIKLLPTVEETVSYSKKEEATQVTQ